MADKEGLSGQEIYDILEKSCGQRVRAAFLDVYSVDRIPLNKIVQHVKQHNTTACIINTAEAHEPKGEHWTAMAYFPKPRRCYYFDSYGFGPIQKGTHSLMLLVAETCGTTCYYNDRELQDLSDSTSTACGFYCIFFVWAACNGWTLKNIIKTFADCKGDKDYLAKLLVHSISHICNTTLPDT